MTYYDKILLDLIDRMAELAHLKILNDAITVLICDQIFTEDLVFDMATGEISDLQNLLHKLLNMRLKTIELFVDTTIY